MLTVPSSSRAWSARPIGLAAAILSLQLVATDSPARSPALAPARRAVAAPIERPAVTPKARAMELYPYGSCPDLDLDADGVTDRFEEQRDSCGTGGCVYDVYLVRSGGADRHVGQVDGLCQLFELGPKHHGLAEINGTWREGTELVKTRYRFDGRAYREVRVESCRYSSELDREVCTRH